jgi:hypothetical protein
MDGGNGGRDGREWGRDGEWTETEWGNQYGMGAQAGPGNIEKVGTARPRPVQPVIRTREAGYARSRESRGRRRALIHWRVDQRRPSPRQRSGSGAQHSAAGRSGKPWHEACRAGSDHVPFFSLRFHCAPLIHAVGVVGCGCGRPGALFLIQISLTPSCCDKHSLVISPKKCRPRSSSIYSPSISSLLRFVVSAVSRVDPPSIPSILLSERRRF